uniref:Uncharacterized protein n=1 Tax=Arundo donax TaxID=35708 RepID=A0A0A9BI23_ARUDO
MVLKKTTAACQTSTLCPCMYSRGRFSSFCALVHVYNYALLDLKYKLGFP